MSKRPKLKNTSIPGTGKQKLQTPCGVVHSIQEPQAPITMHGDLPCFSEYLLSGELFFKWCKDCPLEYRSNNAPKVADVMGTAVLSVLSGHTRFGHGAALCADKVAAELLGIGKVVSHDSLVRGLGKMEATSSRPAFQRIVGRLVKTGGQRIIRLAATGETAECTQKVLTEIGDFLEELLTATRLTATPRWSRVLSRAFSALLDSVPLQALADGNQLLLPM